MSNTSAESANLISCFIPGLIFPIHRGFWYVCGDVTEKGNSNHSPPVASDVTSPGTAGGTSQLGRWRRGQVKYLNRSTPSLGSAVLRALPVTRSPWEHAHHRQVGTKGTLPTGPSQEVGSRPAGPQAASVSHGRQNLVSGTWFHVPTEDISQGDR